MIIRLIQWLLDEPPALSNSATNPSDAMKEERLLTLYRESMAEIRSRRQIDNQLLTFYLAFVTFITGGTLVACSKIEDQDARFKLAAIVISSLIVLWLTVRNRLIHEHESYEHIGQSVVKIWEHYNFFDNSFYYKHDHVLDKDKAGLFGMGAGYLKSLNIVAVTTAVCIVCVIAGAEFIKPPKAAKNLIPIVSEHGEKSQTSCK